MKKITSQQLEELTLMLAYLTSWDENAQGKFGPEPVLRAWKGYDFEILDRLQKQKFIEYKNTSKSLYFTQEGTEMACKLIKKYFEIDTDT